MKNKTLFLLIFLPFLFASVGNATAQQEHEYVDLGLPSGTLWATCNIGADNPWDYGDYFAWGETTTKSDYLWSNYKHANGYYKKLTKYCNQYSYGDNDGTTHLVDDRTILEKSDDVAYQKWGSKWCIPTQAQFKELMDKCIWTWTSCNGKKGYNVKGPNGNTIFLPAAGYKGGEKKNRAHGYYWSSSLDVDYPGWARALNFNSGDMTLSVDFRCYGCSVRPVRCNATSQSQSQSKGKHEYVDLGLPSGTLWATCNVGADNPWDYGDYFAWGETTTKSTYEWSNYKHGNGSDYDVSKKYNGNDHKATLDPSDDAATANWGSDWCIPTQAQFQELYDNCTNEWTTDYKGKGVAGRVFMSKKNGNTIFFPAAGWKGRDGKPSDIGTEGFCWSSRGPRADQSYARYLYFDSYRIDPDHWYFRSLGLSVRPVRCRN